MPDPMTNKKENPKIDFSIRANTQEEFDEWGKFLEWAASMTPRFRRDLMEAYNART